MSMILAVVGGLVVGVLMFGVAPILLGQASPPSVRERIGMAYYHMAAFVMSRMLLVRRSHGGLSLVESTYNAEREAEEATLAGEVGHWRDPYTNLKQFMGQKLGLATEERSAIVTPIAAEVGEARTEQIRDGNDYTETEDGETLYTTFVTVPDRPRLVDLYHAIPVIHGSTTPRMSERAFDFVQKSQEGYDRYQTVKRAMLVIGAYMAGSGLGYLAEQQGAALGGVPDTTDVVVSNPVVWIPSPVLDSVVMLV